MSLSTLDGSGAAGVWVAAPEVTSHSGNPIPDGRDFFVSPPPEIGRVISAESDLTQNQQESSALERLMIAGVCFLIVVLVLASILKSMGSLTLILGGLAGVLSYYFTQFSHHCSYVGEQGIAEFRLQGSRSSRPRATVLLFENATHLYRQETAQYTVRGYSRNRRYQGTEYWFRWKAGDRIKYELRGNYHSKEERPWEGHGWYFAKAAELAWTRFLAVQVEAQLHTFGYVEFALHSELKAIRVGAGFVEFVPLLLGGPRRITAENMQRSALSGGKFEFYYHDPEARWLKDSRYTFNGHRLANLALFLYCLEKVAHIQLEG